MATIDKTVSVRGALSVLRAMRVKGDDGFRKIREPMDFAGIRQAVPVSQPKGLSPVHIIKASFAGDFYSPDFNPDQGCIAVDKKQDIVWFLDPEGSRRGQVNVIGLLIKPDQHPVMPQNRIATVWVSKREEGEIRGRLPKLVELKGVGSVELNRRISSALNQAKGMLNYMWGDPLLTLTPAEKEEESTGMGKGIERLKEKGSMGTPTGVFIRQLRSLVGSYVEIGRWF